MEKKAKGVFWGVGVGPGDPELMTLKAVRMIKENEIIAVPGKVAENTVAYQIAVQVVPELAQKQLLPLDMPMTKDKEALHKSHQKAAAMVEEYLAQGKNVVFLTLGDPTVYSTYSYVQRLVKENGFETAFVSGITSFCAVAATSNTPLTEWSESLHILPATHSIETALEKDATYVLMKSGRKMKAIKDMFSQTDKRVYMIENCGMPEEKVYRSLEELPDESGYFSVIIARDQRREF